MLHSKWHIFLATTVLALPLPASAGEPAAPRVTARQPGGSNEALAGWQWLFEVPLPPPASSPWIDFLLTPAVFDKARADLGDLRLYDGRGREVPYALRIRQDRNEQQPLEARTFNARKNPDRSAEVSLDLGANPEEHREIEIVAGGNDFRRRVRLEGSDDGQQWGALVREAWLVHYLVGSQVIDICKVPYTPSRYRYLRLRVFPDLSKPDDAPGIPEIASATVYHIVQVPGEYVTLPATLGPRDAVRAYEGPGSAWTIDLGGELQPCQRLDFTIDEEDFARPYVLERIEGEGTRSVIVRGEWRRRGGTERRPLEIQFPEMTAHRLRLVVTDHRNPPLSIQSVTYTAAARQIVFARSSDLAAPLRLYVGNPKAEPPHYDFAANLPAVLTPAPARATLGQPADNPDYRPVLKPWTERWPWLVYVVLGGASVVLLGMLAGLARTAIRRHDAEAS